MTVVSDEMLMAYADNELSARERETLEAMLKGDAGLRARLEPFLVTGPSLSAFFEEPLNEPIPARLIEAIAAVPPSPRGGYGPRSANGGTGWLEAIGSLFFPDSPRLAAAFGLAALLVAGGAAGWVMGRSGDRASSTALVALNHGELVAAGPLLAALETVPSKPLAGEVPAAKVQPVQSFHSREGAFCREYRTGVQGKNAFSGVACRQPDGNWRIAAHVETLRPGAALDPSKYGTASGPGAGAASMLDPVIEGLVDGDVLGPEDEAAAMARKWAPAAR